MTPTIGRIVHYRLTKDDAEQINRRRIDAINYAASNDGAVRHTGNVASEYDVVAMVVVQLWGADCVNGQLMLDGNDTLWVTSRVLGDQPGTWAWPPRVEMPAPTAHAGGVSAKTASDNPHDFKPAAA